MRSYRHRNGGGLKVFPAQASADTFIGRGATVEGLSEVYGSNLSDCALKDTFADDSVVARGAVVAGSRLSRASVAASNLERCDVIGAEVAGCVLTGCAVHADAAGAPLLGGVRLTGARVSGPAELIGPWALELEGAHIHAGRWSLPPRHYHVTGENGISVAVVECTEGRVHLGCRCDTVQNWLARGPKFGRRLGWTPEQVAGCVAFLESLRRDVDAPDLIINCAPVSRARALPPASAATLNYIDENAAAVLAGYEPEALIEMGMEPTREGVVDYFLRDDTGRTAAKLRERLKVAPGADLN